MRASSPVFRQISDIAPMIIALDRGSAGFVQCAARPFGLLVGIINGTPTFLVMTKLVPIAMVDTMARISPTYL